MPESLEFLSINLWQTFAAIGNLIILYFIVKRFLFKPVNNILDKRAEEVDKIYNDAEVTLTEAQTDKEIYETKLKNAKNETDTMIKNATERAKARGEEIIQDATSEAENRKRKAESDISLSKKKAMDEMKNNITDMVIELAQQVVEKELDPRSHEKLIDSAIDQLGDRV